VPWSAPARVAAGALGFDRTAAAACLAALRSSELTWQLGFPPVCDRAFPRLAPSPLDAACEEDLDCDPSAYCDLLLLEGDGCPRTAACRAKHASGAACLFARQCASGKCISSTCTQGPTFRAGALEGERCGFIGGEGLIALCADGLVCAPADPATGSPATCVAPLGEGEPCGVSPCARGLACVAGACARPLVRSSIGAPCELAGGVCDPAHGIGCDLRSFSCQPADGSAGALCDPAARQPCADALTCGPSATCHGPAVGAACMYDTDCPGARCDTSAADPQCAPCP